MDLRAKLARLRSMEPPAALFEPPPWAAKQHADPVMLTGSSAHAPPGLSSDGHAHHGLAANELTRAGHAPGRTPHGQMPLTPSEFTPNGHAPIGQASNGLASSGHASTGVAPNGHASTRFAPSGHASTRFAPSGHALNGQARIGQASNGLAAKGQASNGLAASGHASNGFASGLSPHKGERIAQLRSLIAEIAARESRRAPPSVPPPAAKPPPWSQEPTEHGPLHVCARYLEPGHHHGHAPVRAALRALPATLPSLVCDTGCADIDLQRALYLDTETTGLAGGTGTVAFLVGLARFEEESLCLEQLVVPQLGSETPMLARLAQRLAAASCIVTYNGKSFDWPLLRTRFVLARLPIPALPPHVDLLHVCRRLWKKRLASVRLVDMEREVLRFEREDDLPGSEIPTRYFEFLRGGSPERLAPVLEHNQNDIIALPALLGALLQQYEGDRSLCAADDALYFGKLALRARDFERARSFGQQAISHSVGPCETRTALALCAEIEHKLGRIPDAIGYFERAVELESSPGDAADELAKAQLHFTLAKLYEHEQHDLARALRHARHTQLVEGPSLHGRRLGRLYRRLLRSRDSP